MVGPAQQEFEIQEQASYIVAVKPPDISTPGAPSTRHKPGYPERLRSKFGHHRWIDAEPDLLDYEDALLLLLAAHSKEVETEIGIHLDTDEG